jgi:microcystin-dependent protein
MGRVLTTEISGKQCMPSSLEKINTNFANLNTSICTTSSTFTNTEVLSVVGDKGRSYYGMPGIITAFAGIQQPDNWLICNGAEVSKSDYPELYSVIGDIYGTSSSSSTFKLPDLQTYTTDTVQYAAEAFYYTADGTKILEQDGTKTTIEYSFTKVPVNVNTYTYTYSDVPVTYTYTQNGNWTVPAGVTSVKVTVIGGGGGGGGWSLATGGGGGGSGGFDTKTISVTPGTVIPITVGTGGKGGAAATSGTAGKLSSFGSYLTVPGGGGAGVGGGYRVWVNGEGGAPNGIPGTKGLYAGQHSNGNRQPYGEGGRLKDFSYGAGGGGAGNTTQVGGLQFIGFREAETGKDGVVIIQTNSSVTTNTTPVASKNVSILLNSFSRSTFKVPTGVTSISIEAEGGGGGAGGNDVKKGSVGRPGRYIKGTLYVKPGDEFNVYIGTGGEYGANTTGGRSPNNPGTNLLGYDGGKGGNPGGKGGNTGCGGNGGAATVIQGPNNLLIVAGGGGGGGGGSYDDGAGYADTGSDTPQYNTTIAGAGGVGGGGSGSRNAGGGAGGGGLPYGGAGGQPRHQGFDGGSSAPGGFIITAGDNGGPDGKNGGTGYVSINFILPATQNTVVVTSYQDVQVATPVPVTTTINYNQYTGSKLLPTTIRGSSTTSGNLNKYTTATVAPTARIDITGTDGVVGTSTYNTKKYFNSLTTYPSGNYRVQYVDGAWSQYLNQYPFAGGCYIGYKNSSNTTQIDPIGNNTVYTTYTNAISASKNYFGTDQPYYYDFFHNGGELYLCAGDSIYSDNRAAAVGAPLWSLYTLMSTAAFNFIISTKS